MPWFLRPRPFIPLSAAAAHLAHGLRPCLCLCAVAHPGIGGCISLGATAVIRVRHRAGVHQVPMCGPCAAVSRWKTQVTR